ncbi:MAG TPA: hypothetical protein VJC09_03025, partial [Candidatus Saccharimonadales bacterium]|nr:hypothetical protein [Candidatus Saccharimonadales bacterium]
IGAVGVSTLFGEKRGRRTIRPDRHFNPDSYSGWHETVKNLSRPLKDRVLQRPRDGVLIAAHPSAAAHAVAIDRKPRRAYLYDYHIVRTK